MQNTRQREYVFPGEACMCARRSRWCTALSTGLHERSHSAQDSPDGESFSGGSRILKSGVPVCT